MSMEVGLQVGFSKLDQPMIYSCLAMAKDRDVMANREHMLVTFEQVRLLNYGQGIAAPGGDRKFRERDRIAPILITYCSCQRHVSLGGLEGHQCLHFGCMEA